MRKLIINNQLKHSLLNLIIYFLIIVVGVKIGLHFG